LSEAARKAFNAMNTKGYEYRSEFARHYVAQGKAEGKAQALLQFLEARGLEVPEEVRLRITGCTDEALLDTWIRRSVTAASAREVVGLDS
jgi:hypothetical protein